MSSGSKPAKRKRESTEQRSDEDTREGPVPDKPMRELAALDDPDVDVFVLAVPDQFDVQLLNGLTIPTASLIDNNGASIANGTWRLAATSSPPASSLHLLVATGTFADDGTRTIWRRTQNQPTAVLRITRQQPLLPLNITDDTTSTVSSGPTVIGPIDMMSQAASVPRQEGKILMRNKPAGANSRGPPPRISLEELASDRSSRRKSRVELDTSERKKKKKSRSESGQSVAANDADH